ncbi:Uncharacterised protein [uncultured archaeon]|nr:Uncharacterised protein [uncultured archaeon]
MGTFFDGEIQGKRRLHIPKCHRDAVFGSENEFFTSHWTNGEVNLLVMYRKELFLPLRERLYLKRSEDVFPYREAYASTELTKMDDKERIILHHSSLAHLYGLSDRTNIDSIVRPVKGDNRGDFLVLAAPENFEKYVQSTVNSSESCSTSSIPNRAPASNQP